MVQAGGRRFSVHASANCRAISARQKTLNERYLDMAQPAVDNLSQPIKHEHLAFMIADAFNDLAQIKLYVIYCKKYPRETIQRAFAEAKAYPEARLLIHLLRFAYL